MSTPQIEALHARKAELEALIDEKSKRFHAKAWKVTEKYEYFSVMKGMMQATNSLRAEWSATKVAIINEEYQLKQKRKEVEAQPSGYVIASHEEGVVVCPFQRAKARKWLIVAAGYNTMEEALEDRHHYHLAKARQDVVNLEEEVKRLRALNLSLEMKARTAEHLTIANAALEQQVETLKKRLEAFEASKPKRANGKMTIIQPGASGSLHDKTAKARAAARIRQLNQQLAEAVEADMDEWRKNRGSRPEPPPHRPKPPMLPPAEEDKTDQDNKTND